MPHPSGMPPTVFCFGVGSDGNWGVLVGGAVARITDLFTGSVRGVTVHWEILSGFQPFRYWPAFDIAPQLLTLWIASSWRRRQRKPGRYLLAFLSIYGASRFGLECVRDTYHWIGPLTYGHVLAAIQCAAGITLLVAQKPRLFASVGVEKVPGCGRSIKTETNGMQRVAWDPQTVRFTVQEGARTID